MSQPNNRFCRYGRSNLWRDKVYLVPSFGLLCSSLMSVKNQGIETVEADSWTTTTHTSTQGSWSNRRGWTICHTKSKTSLICGEMRWNKTLEWVVVATGFSIKFWTCRYGVQQASEAGGRKWVHGIVSEGEMRAEQLLWVVFYKACMSFCRYVVM